MEIDCPNSLKRCASAPMINNILQPNQAPQMTSTTQQIVSNSPISRDNVPSTLYNILSPRARRHSGSFSPLNVGNGGLGAPRLTPRVSQLRQEECADITNSREMNHEREIHSAIQMSQSCDWEGGELGGREIGEGDCRRSDVGILDGGGLGVADEGGEGEVWDMDWRRDVDGAGKRGADGAGKRGEDGAGKRGADGAGR